MNKMVLAVVILSFFLGVASTLVAMAAMQWTWRVSNVASVKAVGVGVYADPGFTVPLTSIDWGILEPGSSKNFSAYIVNRSNVPVVLSLATENWNPINASAFITLTWNYAGVQIPVGGSIYVVFVLHVDSAISGITAFSFTILIVGSG